MKRSRTQNDVLDCVELGKHLEPYAKLKTAPWDWEVARYGKTRRSQGPDRQGLEAYDKLLQVILLAAPTGHPPLYRLREVWVWLHKEHNIMASDIQKRGMPVSDWASQSADNIRLMCKHLLDLRASRTTFLSPTLAALVGMIAEDKEPALPAPETMPKKILQAQASAASSVCFCGAKCQCPDCKEVDTVDLLSQASSTSLAAENLQETVPATSNIISQILKKPCRSSNAGDSKSSAKLVQRSNPPEAYFMIQQKYFI